MSGIIKEVLKEMKLGGVIASLDISLDKPFSAKLLSEVKEITQGLNLRDLRLISNNKTKYSFFGKPKSLLILKDWFYNNSDRLFIREIIIVRRIKNDTRKNRTKIQVSRGG